MASKSASALQIYLALHTIYKVEINRSFFMNKNQENMIFCKKITYIFACNELRKKLKQGI